MTSLKTCSVKDRLESQLIALNGKVDRLSPHWVADENARVEIQAQREILRTEITRHLKKGHEGKPCPFVQRFS